MITNIAREIEGSGVGMFRLEKNHALDKIDGVNESEKNSSKTRQMRERKRKELIKDKIDGENS